MKIQGAGQIQGKRVGKTDRKRSSDGAAFASELAENSTGSVSASTMGGAAPIANVNTLLALQEVPDATHGASKGLARAEEMMDLLEEVRKGLLLGSIPVGRLKSLADVARGQRLAGEDPKLAEILEDIELRAEVELAKLGF